MSFNRKCVDGGVGTGIPGTAIGGGPGGQGTGPDPGGGGGAGAVGSVSSNSVTQYSVTAGCTAVDTVNELGAVGEFCWLQDTMVTAASERTMNGAINFGDVSDIVYSWEPKLFGLIGFRPQALTQNVNHELERPNSFDFSKYRTEGWVDSGSLVGRR